MQPSAEITSASKTNNMSSVRRLVTSTFEETASAQSRALKPLNDHLPLADSGLDSLCFAIIVAQLEDELGVDPFSDLDEAFFPESFGEFVRLYEAAAAQRPAP